MNTLRLCFIIILPLLSCFPAISQRIRVFTSDGDLSSSLVNKLYQDSRGYMWIATEHGLNLFDGTRFKVYHKERGVAGSLSGNYVHTIHEDRHGHLRVGTINGLMEYERNTDSFRDIKAFLRDEQVSAHIVDLLELSNGEIWVATAGYGVFVYDESSDCIRSFDSLNALVGDDMISCLYEDQSHAVWIGTEKRGVCRYYPSSNSARNFMAPELSGNIVTCVMEDAERNLLVGTLDGGVSRFDRVTEKFVTLAGGSAHASVKTLARIKDRVYAGTDGQGVKLVTGNVVEDVAPGNGIAEFYTGKVHQIIEDRDGNIWLGLFQKGIAFIPRKRFKFNYMGKWIKGGRTIGDGCVMAIYVDPDRRKWVSCDNDGLFCLDESNSLIDYYPVQSTVMSFLSDSNGSMWIGTYTSGVMRYEAGKGWVKVNKLSDRKTYCLAEGPGGRLYVGSLDKGLESFDPSTDEVKNCLVNLKNTGDAGNVINSVNNLRYSGGDRLWVAHYNGISCYDTRNERFVNFGNYINLISGCIGYAILESGNGLMWFGTSDGLYCYNKEDGSIKHFTVDDGLPDDVVCGLCEDEGSNLWISTYHGLSRFDPSDGTFQNFDAGDELQGNEFTHGAFFKDEKGIIYFGGTNGVTFFHPYDIEDNSHGYSPVITEVGVFTPTDNEQDGGYRVVSADCNDRSEIELNYRQNNINILFSTLTYENPDKIVYEYRILGQDKNWLTTEPGQNRISFYNMRPGHYKFEVRVAGDTNPAGTRSIAFEITPPWYLSWWALTLYGILVLVLVGLILVHWRARVMTQRELVKRKQDEDIAEAKLQLFTNISHEIRTPMTLIIGPLQKLMTECTDHRLSATYNIIYRNASRILSLVNQLMDVRKLDKGQMKLRARETDLVGFIEDVMRPFEYYAEESHITFMFVHPQEKVMGWIDLENFDKVLMNLVSNAFKYTPEGGTITIMLDEGSNGPVHTPLEKYIEIKVRDTGNGINPEEAELIFERFYRMENIATQSSFGTGIGLHLVRSIVVLHHGTVFARNREDGVGAEFVIRIPKGSDHLSLNELTTTESYAPVLKKVPLEPFRMSDFEAWDIQSSKISRHHIVVVEDDDDIRMYLSKELKSRYSRVSLFSNGEEAFHAILAMNPVPDLIITDIMMPGMDGITLTRKIKQNVNTNHTPVILLSAKSDPEEIKAGMESGADNYMVKPFNSELLFSTVDNLLSNRHLLKAKFSGSQEQSDKVSEIKLKSQDEVLMKRIMDVINTNISSSDFSVERLAESVGLSRAHLHRKLKEYTNLSARDFIKSIRMRQAAKLLKEKDLSVAEVAYATGFANASHFSNAFKETFGVTPTQYASSKDPVQ